MTNETRTTPASVALATTQDPRTVEDATLPIAEDIVVIAKTREEMAVAQRSLIGWIGPKIAVLEQEVVEAQTNLDIATKRKWATVAFKKALTVAQGRLGYYRRIGAALEAGYVIMPDLDGATIAVRTSQQRPRKTVHKSRWSTTDLPRVLSDGSDAGKGAYVDPNMRFEHWERTDKDERGNDRTMHMAKAHSFDSEFAFPVMLVKPQILDAANQAMLLKVFDEIGIVGAGSGKPGQKLRATEQLHGDPILLGRVVNYEGNKRRTCAFLITWWVDTKAI
jgi:hypothetical protein